MKPSFAPTLALLITGSALADEPHYRSHAWAGAGIYRFSQTVGGISATSTDFGLNVGGTYGLLPLFSELTFSLLGNAAVAFGNTSFLPLTAGLALQYGGLPLQVTGGFGFTLAPRADLSGTTPAGWGILLHAAYPLSQVTAGFGVYAQAQYHFLSDGVDLLVFNAGGQIGF
jgi:hypothetical protein